MESAFENDLAAAINKNSQENGSNTPDFILGRYLEDCLKAFNRASTHRESWYGKSLRISGDEPASERARHVAARVWCDPSMNDTVMDVGACENIAKIVDAVWKKQKVS